MLFVARTMARRGLLTPGPPHRVARQLAALHTWKLGLAGELRQAAARSPARVALIDEGGVTTYEELLDRTSRLAAALPAEPGDRVGILSRNSSAMVEALIAVATLGADPVLMNTGLSAEQLAAVVRDQQLRLILHDPALTPPPDGSALTFGQIGYAAPLTKPPVRPGRTTAGRLRRAPRAGCSWATRCSSRATPTARPGN
ncbi:MAG: AMP-binding protein [Actinomycetota bacterium]|nr:AMP-binding protein [Actinomycetota bacterium]